MNTTTTRSGIPRPQPGRHWRAGVVASVAVLLAATALGTWLTFDVIRQNQTDRLDYETSQTDIALEVRLEAYVQVLRAGAGFFEGSETVTRREWVEFVDTLGLAERYPGFKSLSWAPAVPDDRLDEFVRAVRAGPVPADIVDRSLITDYTPRSPTGVVGRTELHSPILYVAPWVAENQVVLGVDMMQDPARRATMEQAVATNTAVLSPKLRLATQTDARAGFIAYLPVYKDGRLEGWLTAAFRAPDMIAGLRGDMPHAIEFQIEDGDGNLLFSTAGVDATGAPRPLPASAGLVRDSSPRMPGRTWDVHYVTTADFVTATERFSPWVVAAGGLLVTGLVLALGTTGAGWRSLAAELDAERGVATMSAERARVRATTDPLTGLANRMLFEETIAAWVENGPFVLAYVDVDGFKPVNDVLGHRAGDALLRAIGRRMQGNVAHSDLVARLGGDEFVVLFRGRDDTAPVVPTQPFGPATRLAETLARPYRIMADDEIYDVRISVSIGTACFPHDGDTAPALIHAADIAMYAAKAVGGGGCRAAGTLPVDGLGLGRRLGRRVDTSGASSPLDDPDEPGVPGVPV